MKKKLLFFLLLASNLFLLAQPPMYFNTATVGGQNSIPLSSGAQMVWRRVQWFIGANSLGSVPQAHNITKIYFLAGSTANVTYPNLYIRLKTGTGTGLTGTANGPFEPNMVQVFHGVNYQMTTTSGQWFSITLQTPFLYDPTQPLYVDVEHDHNSANGPTVCQAVNIPGPGNGRQWGNNNNSPINGVGTQQVNFGIDVLPATPCNTPPPTNTIMPVNFTTCPGINNPNLTLAQTYSFSGITYQWMSSTVSPVGPFNAIPNSTMMFAPTPTIGTTTWYQVVATCTNPGGGATTLPPTQYFVAGNVTNTVPYYEDFEGLQMANRLPNCSWYAASLGTVVTSYMGPQSNNRLPRSGSKFGAFVAPANNQHVYSNGITMYPGITYSAAIWYSTEYFGYTNWSSLSLLVGQSQSPTGLVPIATVTPAVSGAYKLLSGVFTVPTQGDYYIAIRANGSSGSALYLNFDDLSVTIPCYGPGAVNSPTLTLSTSASTICAGDALNLTANGADTYTWSNFANGNSIVDNPVASTIYSVIGTNSLTGCADTLYEPITVNALPTIFIAPSAPTVCAGSQVHLNAFGQNIVSYSWNNGSNGSNITVNPTSATSYTVIGTSVDGCVNTAVQTIAVSPLPTILLSSDNPGVACHNEAVNLSASGGITYTWVSSGSSVMYGGSSIHVVPGVTSVYTVTGTNANGCSNKTTITQNVQDCTSLTDLSIKGMKVYPNPTTGLFSVEIGNTSKTIKVTDITGRTVREASGSEDTVQINLNELAAGVYYLTVNTENASQTVKLIKE